jgi:hypothetical protein
MSGYSGDGFASSIEMVATVVLFVLGGVALDRSLDSGPWFAVGFGVFAVAGTMAKQWFVYNARMEAQEANLRLAREEAAAAARAEQAIVREAVEAEQAQLAQHLATQRPADALSLETIGGAVK